MNAGAAESARVQATTSPASNDAPPTQSCQSCNPVQKPLRPLRSLRENHLTPSPPSPPRSLYFHTEPTESQRTAKPQFQVSSVQFPVSSFQFQVSSKTNLSPIGKKSELFYDQREKSLDAAIALAIAGCASLVPERVEIAPQAAQSLSAGLERNFGSRREARDARRLPPPGGRRILDGLRIGKV